MTTNLTKNRRPSRNTYTEYKGNARASSRSNSRYSAPSSIVVQEPARDKHDAINYNSFKKSMTWLGSTIVVICIFLLLGYAFVTLSGYVMTHPFFAVKAIYVDGISRFKPEEIQSLAGLQEGDNTFTLSITEMESRILQNSWIESVTITRELPSTFYFSVVERVPRFWVLRNGALYYLDDKARVIAPVESDKFLSLPTLDIGMGAEEALAVLPDFLEEIRTSNFPFDLDQISWLRLSAGKGFELYWENRKLNLSIAVEDWRRNLENIVFVIKDLEKRQELEYIMEIRADNNQAWFTKK